MCWGMARMSARHGDEVVVAGLAGHDLEVQVIRDARARALAQVQADVDAPRVQAALQRVRAKAQHGHERGPLLDDGLRPLSQLPLVFGGKNSSRRFCRIMHMATWTMMNRSASPPATGKWRKTGPSPRFAGFRNAQPAVPAAAPRSSPRSNLNPCEIINKIAMD